MMYKMRRTFFFVPDSENALHSNPYLPTYTHTHTIDSTCTLTHSLTHSVTHQHIKFELDFMESLTSNNDVESARLGVAGGEVKPVQCELLKMRFIENRYLVWRADDIHNINV